LIPLTPSESARAVAARVELPAEPMDHLDELRKRIIRSFLPVLGFGGRNLL